MTGAEVHLSIPSDLAFKLSSGRGFEGIEDDIHGSPVG
jgi:hypothetical protein